MSIEIERKFLVDSSKLPLPDYIEEIEQWYLVNTKELTVRVRIYDDTDIEFTVKGSRVGLSCPEFNATVLPDDKDVLRKLLGGYPYLKKTRAGIYYRDELWEVDTFEDGLVVAEIELADEAIELPLPPWVTEEVTCDPRYFNCNMVK